MKIRTTARLFVLALLLASGSLSMRAQVQDKEKEGDVALERMQGKPALYSAGHFPAYAGGRPWQQKEAAVCSEL